MSKTSQAVSDISLGNQKTTIGRLPIVLTQTVMRNLKLRDSSYAY
jgi:hypothetical protein